MRVTRVGALVEQYICPLQGSNVWSLDDKVSMAIVLEDLLGCGRVDLVVLLGSTR